MKDQSFILAKPRLKKKLGRVGIAMHRGDVLEDIFSRWHPFNPLELSHNALHCELDPALPQPRKS